MTTTTEVSVGDCVHHWMIQTEGARSESHGTGSKKQTVILRDGTCRKCGVDRTFRERVFMWNNG